MLDLIGLDDLTLNLLFVLYFLGMLIQCLLFYMTIKDTRTEITLIAFEGSLILVYAWVSWYVGTLKDSAFNIVAWLPGADLRLAFLPVVLAGLWHAVTRRHLRLGLSALLLLFMQSFIDTSADSTGLRLAAAGTMLTLMSLWALSKKLAGMRDTITGLSVKEALDTLPDGMMLARQHGRPVSINRQARQMISQLGLSPDEHFNVLWQKLSQHPGRVLDLEEQDEDGLLIQLEQDRHIYLTYYPLTFKRRSYIQLHVRDVSKEYRIVQQIRTENRKLTANASELRQLLHLAEENARRKAVLDSRARLHDILSQRLSLTRTLLTRLEKTPDPILLEETRKMLGNIGEELFFERDMPARTVFDQLVQTYRSFGIDIVSDGFLPDVDALADICVQILREALSNALRHAGASSIKVQFADHRHTFEMIISNNGYCPAAAPREGNGIQSMRSRLEAVSGNLDIELAGAFTLRVSIPRPDHRQLHA